MVLVVVVLALVLGLYLGGHPDRLPGFVRETFVAQQPNKLVTEAVERIQHDYYRPVGEHKLDEASLNGIIGSLHDRFSHYLSPSEYGTFIAPPHFTGIGIAVAATHSGLLIARVFNSSPAQHAGLRDGETILAVDGRRLSRVHPEEAVTMIKGLPGTDVVLTVRNGATHKVRAVTVQRAVITEPVVASDIHEYHGHKIGVVALASFTPGAAEEVHQAVAKVLHEGAQAIVFDLRSNGGGLVIEAQRIASIFIAHGLIVSMHGRAVGEARLYASHDAIAPKIPMVVLVDGNTASAAEIVTAALQDHRRATVVGTHTFGKGVFQEEQSLSNGGALDITVGEYFTPDGRNLGGGGVRQGAGVIPEVKVHSGVDGEAGLKAALATVAAKFG